ncbi:hypothetical protein Sme01_59940 [Sphaerisporangium melleum]|uniref:Putative Flp pilus-assembly TadG-like N-terminal domain-containing protein n=2 Tax=Sphaerisporangium melleum TaxID=321316 RepID=A0A917RC00_9ACTN|nr:hypothetical protein GCM10007964_46130 [Sphaerisporangium melleum]GII73518.1 hypothetical protein Sme01_59940 [Sphaerisporangium melleum]
MAVIWFIAAALLVVGAGRIARHRAQSAADLSALAGAARAIAAPETACRSAREAAKANRASVSRCVVGDGVVFVRVKVALTLPWTGDLSAVADARAGPR